jgi:hypothetical protein
METVAVTILPYLTTVIGFLIVWVLNGIKGEIREIKTTVGGLRDELIELDHRVVKIEAGCSFMHGVKED